MADSGGRKIDRRRFRPEALQGAGTLPGLRLTRQVHMEPFPFGHAWRPVVLRGNYRASGF